jgi:Co/Zn/Cd efflux system component
MFVIEASAGWLAHSTALLADSLDMLGDALVYGFSLFVLSRSVRWQAGATLGKGIFMSLFGAAILAEAGTKVLVPVLPDALTMSVVGLVALAANTACFVLLYRHRSDNLNMSSTWLCSRNDLTANLGVLVAAFASATLTSKWPDIIVGVAIAGLFLRSANHVIRQALHVLRESPGNATGALESP